MRRFEARDKHLGMKPALTFVRIALLVFAGGACLKDLNVSHPERNVLSSRVISSMICIRCHGVDEKGDLSDYSRNAHE